MTTNRVQFQPGLSMAEFMEHYGSDEKCEARRWSSRAGRKALPARRAAMRPEQLVSHAPGCCTSSAAPCRHQCSVISGTIFESTKLGLSRLVPGHAPAEPVQEQRRCARADAPPGRLLQDRLAGQAQAHGGHASTGEEHRQLDGRVELDDAYLGGERIGRQGRARIREQGAVRGRGADHAGDGQPQFVWCLRPTAVHARRGGGVPRDARSPPSAAVVSDGLWCFRGAVQIVGAEHERVVTGGGKASPDDAAAVQGDQHFSGQPQDAPPQRHLPRLRLRQVRPSLSRQSTNIDSIADSICAPSSIASCVRCCGLRPLRNPSSVLLRLVPNQVHLSLGWCTAARRRNGQPTRARINVRCRRQLTSGRRT